jgi:hypothetical protein
MPEMEFGADDRIVDGSWEIDVGADQSGRFVGEHMSRVSLKSQSHENIADVHAIVRSEDAAALTPLITRAQQRLIATFGRSGVRDEAAVRAAIVLQ